MTEDYTTYTDNVPASVSIAPTKLTLTDFDRDDFALLHKSYDASASLTHYVSTKVESGFGGFSLCYPWALVNDTTKDFIQLYVADEDSLCMYTGRLSSNKTQVGIWALAGASKQTDAINTLDMNTQFWHEIVWSKEFGSFGQLQCLTFDDEGLGDLVHTLALTLVADNNFTDIQGCMSYEIGDSSRGFTGFFENLDLQEVAAATGYKNLLLKGVG